MYMCVCLEPMNNVMSGLLYAPIVNMYIKPYICIFFVFCMCLEPMKNAMSGLTSALG
jgi:hypothetical protein